MGRQGHSGAKSLNVATVTEPKAGSTARTGQGTRFSTVHLFQLRAHKSNSDASNQARDEGRESKAKLPNGESGCKGEHHGQQKKTDNSSHNFGNMMIRTNWSCGRSLSMGHTVVMLCATMIWIQQMRGTPRNIEYVSAWSQICMRCQHGGSFCSILLELFVHGRHKAFLPPYRVYGLDGLVLGEEVEVALVDFDMDFFWVFLNFLGMQWVAMVNGRSGLVLSSEHDGDTVGDSVGSSSSSSQCSTMREYKGRNKLEVLTVVTDGEWTIECKVG